MRMLAAVRSDVEKHGKTCVPQDAERARPVGTAMALEFAACRLRRDGRLPRLALNGEVISIFSFWSVMPPAVNKPVHAVKVQMLSCRVGVSVPRGAQVQATQLAKAPYSNQSSSHAEWDGGPYFNLMRYTARPLGGFCPCRLFLVTAPIALHSRARVEPGGP